ncbi:Pyridoxal phosphate-dependent transferase [Moorella glycerini]|uniref:Aminotransferase n=1 Tax=Neomoorella stamsii TaxID=1266720 RepID=A0A9X7J449_9FIRM|nr:MULTISPECIES: pyridoxal phosphate-dependent aminotransferase [Moorella]PRR73965.1 Aspartate aminotransferase [Moorella stamsii]CEP66176.1 Pyridoxal phosphate-dependent transferase [Moorella glycerini]
MPELSKLVAGLKRSGIREIGDLAAGMEGVISLQIGEPLFSTPPHIIDAACEAVKAGFTKYTPNPGLPSVRAVIARRLNEDYQLKLTPENVVLTVGGIGALATAIRALTDAGDEVLIPDPGWPNYEMTVECADAVPRRYELDQARGFIPAIEDLEKLITPKTKVLLINSPSNPLGTVFPGAIMRELVDFARRYDLYIVSDEVYEKIIYDGKHASALSFDTDGRVVGIFSFSKTYAMTGWRVGYAVAAEPLARQIAKLQEAYVSSAAAVSQKAAEAAITGAQDCVENMRKAYEENRNVACQVLDSFGINYQKPLGAFYMWVEVNCEDSTEFAKRLLIEQKVAVAPGTTFGPSGKRHIRISLASPREAIREGLHRLGLMLKS